MAFISCLVGAGGGAGSGLIRVGHPLLDAYLELVAAWARPNTVLAEAYGTALPAYRFAVAFLHAQRGRHADAKAIVDELWREGVQGAFRGIDASSCVAMIAETVVLLGDAGRAAELYRNDRARRGSVASSLETHSCISARSPGSSRCSPSRPGKRSARSRGSSVRSTIHRRMRARPFIARTAIEYGSLLRKRKAPGASAKAAMLTPRAKRLRRRSG